MFRPATGKASRTPHLTHTGTAGAALMTLEGRRCSWELAEVSEQSPKVLTLHGWFPRIVGNCAADHWSWVGATGARAVVGRLLGAGVKAVAAAAAEGSAAASCGVRRWLDPGTQSKGESQKQEKPTLGTNSLKWAGLRTRFCGYEQWTGYLDFAHSLEVTW